MKRTVIIGVLVLAALVVSVRVISRLPRNADSALLGGVASDSPTPTIYAEDEEEFVADTTPHTKVGGNFRIIKFRNGMNDIDLNADGVSDLVIMLRRENGTSPHWYSTYTFAVHSGGVRQGGAPYWHAVSIWQLKQSANSEIYVDSLSTGEGADGILEDARLIATANRRPVLVFADRESGESFASPGKVSFHFYELIDNTDGDWSSDYSYVYRSTAVTKEKYVDVGEAIEKELTALY